MGNQFGFLSVDMIAAAHQIAGGSPLFGVDIGQRKRSATQQHGDLVRIDPVVLGFTAMDRAHIERMTEDEFDPLVITEIGQPVPGEHALTADHQAFAVRLDHTEEGFWFGPDVLVKDHLAERIDDAEVHSVGVQIDTAVKLMLFVVESHGAGSFV